MKTHLHLPKHSREKTTDYIIYIYNDCMLNILDAYTHQFYIQYHKRKAELSDVLGVAGLCFVL